MPAARRLVAALVGAAVATGLFLVAGPAPTASATQRVTAAGTSTNGASHSAVPAAQAKVVGVTHDHVHLDVPGLLPGLVVAAGILLLLGLSVAAAVVAVGATAQTPTGRGPPRR